MARTATYKGKTYNLLFVGPTKFGRRARLQFLDGSKDFWVDAGQVVEAGASAAPQAGGRPSKCSACGAAPSRRGEYDNGVKILRSGECLDCYEERKMGY